MMLIIAFASACVLGIGVGAAALYVDSLAEQFDEQTAKIVDAFPSETLRPAPPTPTPTPSTSPTTPPPAPMAAQNILLLGSDTRASVDSIDSVDGRSDTMMLVNISADRGHVTVMSIMRDSWVDIPGHGEANINAAMPCGGVPLAVQTFE
jgi:anionic cell wall polymer biosynthesis LytR-Cps2A-Psr (LCP) family protein